MLGLISHGGRAAPTGRWRRRRPAPALGLLAAVALVSMLLAGCGGGGGGGNSSTSSAFRIGNTPWASSISYNPYNPDYVPLSDFAQLGLGAVSDWNHPGSDPYYPELATGWTVANNTITFHIRPSAKWQNGAAFTSGDVMTSMLGAGADYNSVWGSMTGVSAPNQHTFVVSLQSWAVAQTVLLHLLEVPIIPTSQYGSLFPSGFEQNVKSYWKTYDLLHPTGATIAAASNSPAGKVLSTVSGKMIKFNPSKLLGNGPYSLESANVSGILYQKWSGFWDASKITAPYVQIYPMSVSSQYGSLSTGSIEFEQDAQFTDPQVTKLDQSKGGHYIFIPSPVQQESLVFHLDSYPFGLLPVRQAFAYVIDRPKLTQLDMGGTLIQDPPTVAPDGINDFLAKSYLSKSQFASMNHYSFDQAKAASLLEGAGFSKKAGTWYTPKGQPFTVTIDEEAGYSQLDEDGIVIANDLKNFGIKADTDDVNAATYVTEEEAGDLAVSEQFMDWGQGSPMADFAATFGEPTTPAWNYAISYPGSGACSCAIGIGPTADVPGLGNVNIASALNDEVNSGQPNTWSGYVWDWSRWVNQNLPILPLYNNAFHESYSTARYSNYPPASQKWLWTGLTGAAQPVLWMQDGYLKLKSSSS